MDYRVFSLNVGEPDTAVLDLLATLPRGAMVLADANYDSRFLLRGRAREGCDAAHAAQGASERSHKLKEMGPAQREAIDAWNDQPELCEHHPPQT